jgi:hypothetical protein
MDTINMKKINGVYTVDMDPYSEYVHRETEVDKTKVDGEKFVVDSIDKSTDDKDKIKQVKQNINELFDGIDVIFDIANTVVMRFGGR